jgi:anti-sigma-K factor RskA
MTSHDTFAASVAAYALGALDADERVAFEAHLPTCAECQRELREMRRVAHGIDLAVAPEAPPASLRERALAFATAQPQEPAASTKAPLRGSAAIRPVPSKTGVLDRPRTKQPLPQWVPLALAASLGLALLAGLYAFALQSQVSSLREMVLTSSDEADRLRDELVAVRQDTQRLVYTVNIVTAPDVKRVSLKGIEAGVGASGLAFWSPTQGIVLNADQLPALQPDRIYQLWVIQAGKVSSAGTFTVAQNGRASITAPLPAGVTSVDAVAVSLEAAPGVPSKVGPFVLLGKAE